MFNKKIKIALAGALLTASAVGAVMFFWTRSPIRSAEQAMRLAVPPKELLDDMNFSDFAASLKNNINQLKSVKASTLRFGPVEILKSDYIAAQEDLYKTLKADSSGRKLIQKLTAEFDFYEVYGDEKWGQVFITSYYEPIIKGRSYKTKLYSQPLYGVPTDMVTIDFSSFSKTFTDLQHVQQLISEKSRDGLLRGRLVSEGWRGTRVVPYYSREEIQKHKMNNAEILCYVEPVDAFFLQIQGSGLIKLEEGKELRLGYGAQNGHTYRAIGKYLFDVIPKEEMSAQKIMAYLRSLSPVVQQEILNLNPSYVFFQKLEGQALTSFGNEVAPGRTIATDSKYFPKGALAYLEYNAPQFSDETSDKVISVTKSSRFVLDQDTGGAIRGPHRVDLFSGRGPAAARMSGVMRNSGRLYYILPKKQAL